MAPSHLNALGRHLALAGFMGSGKTRLGAEVASRLQRRFVDLDREIETQFFGRKSAAWLLQLAGVHSVGHGGDIAAVKGMQGLKGLPF